MTETGNGLFTGMLETLGRFLYKVLLAVAIVWVLGLIVGLLVGVFDGAPAPNSGSGPPLISSSW